ncbi:hypothetical protein K439DRAFT_1611832 [Ramaria rubella]|nr:hypothetical protein K439DRAFT_1611832 [Ramaria rubella]
MTIVDLVWRGASPKSWPRLIFLAARYAAPFALIFNCVALLNTHTTDDASLCCSLPLLPRLTCLVGLFYIFSSHPSASAVEVGYFFMDGQVMYFSRVYKMRLWAMYRSRRVLIAMTIVVSIALVAMGIIEGLGYSKVEATNEPIPNQVHICGPGHLPNYVYAFWIPPLLVETISVVLVAHKAILYFQGNATTYMFVSQRCLAYSVLVLYVANLYIWARLPINTFELLIPLTYALPSIAGNRMLLSLRSVFYADHAMLPGQRDTIGLTLVNPDRGLTVHTHNPLKEFDSFFGEKNHQ